MPNEQDIALMRAAVLCLINRERASAGERALAPAGALVAAAQGHSNSMAADDYFEHVGPGGETPAERMRAAGYLNGALAFEVGENIGFGTGSLSTPRAVVAAWMASPGHRANILDAHFRDTGIGVNAHPPASLADGGRGAVYTQDFGFVAH